MALKDMRDATIIKINVFIIIGNLFKNISVHLCVTKKKKRIIIIVLSECYTLPTNYLYILICTLLTSPR